MTVYIRVLRARADQAVTSAVPYAALLICETVIQGTLLVGVSHLVPPSIQIHKIWSFDYRPL